jgi:hypothetical protein
MAKVIHIIGNGDNAHLYQPAKGLKIACNLPPFDISNIFVSCMVDFKMMKAITEGSVTNPYPWVLGVRPQKWMEMRQTFYMKYSPQVKEFYTVLPKYAKNYTDFNCGHFATHYAANKLKGEEIHLYGFDSIMDFNILSKTDFYLPSDRGAANTERLTRTWRPIFQGIFKEFSDTQFVIHHKHDNLPFKKPENLEIRVHK